MKIYRGPSGKPLQDDTHVLVATVDVPAMAEPWHSTFTVRANVTKDIQERQSVAHVSVAAADAVALHDSLLKGLLARSVALDEANVRIEKLQGLFYELNSALEEVERISYSDDEDESYGLSPDDWSKLRDNILMAISTGVVI